MSLQPTGVEHTRPVKGRQAFRAAPLNGCTQARTPLTAMQRCPAATHPSEMHTHTHTAEGQWLQQGGGDRSQRPFCQSAVKAACLVFSCCRVLGGSPPLPTPTNLTTPGLGCRHEDPCRPHVSPTGSRCNSEERERERELAHARNNANGLLDRKCRRMGRCAHVGMG